MLCQVAGVACKRTAQKFVIFDVKLVTYGPTDRPKLTCHKLTICTCKTTRSDCLPPGGLIPTPWAGRLGRHYILEGFHQRSFIIAEIALAKVQIFSNGDDSHLFVIEIIHLGIIYVVIKYAFVARQ